MPVVLCTAAQPGRAGLRRRSPGVRVAYVQVAGGALPVSLSDTVRRCSERGLIERRLRRRAVPRRGRAVRDGGRGALAGRRRRATTRPSARSARASSGPARGSATARSRSRTPRTPRPRSADGRCWPCDARTPIRASATAASRTTRRPCSTCALGGGRRAGRRATATAGRRRAPGCRSRTWAAAPTRIPRSSAPPTPPGVVARGLLG